MYMKIELWYFFLEIMTLFHRNYDIHVESAKLKLLTPLLIILCLYHDSQDVIMRHREKKWWIYVETELWHSFLEFMTSIHKNYDISTESAKLKLLTIPSRSFYHSLPISWLSGCHNMVWIKTNDEYMEKQNYDIPS